MVSIRQIGDKHGFVRKHIAVGLSDCPQLPFRGLNIPLYKLGNSISHRNEAMGCTFGEESLLDVLLLAQWEDRAWKGLVRYDVTSCETKIVGDRFKFLAQWNDLSVPEDLACHDSSDADQSVDSAKSSIQCVQREDLLFCVACGEDVIPEYIPSSRIPCNGSLIIMNENPIEYGHVFLAPFAACSVTHMVDLKSVELALQIAAEACYLANPLPVEIIPGVSLLGSSQGGIEVCELTDYPIKSLLFKSQQNVRRMVELVAEISSCLQAQNMLFNLLISDGGNKVFLFPQVSTSISGNKLTAWECAGHFVFRQESNFIEATEKDIAKRLTISSLDDAAFQALKQLCCAVACNLIRT